MEISAPLEILRFEVRLNRGEEICEIDSRRRRKASNQLRAQARELAEAAVGGRRNGWQFHRTNFASMSKIVVEFVKIDEVEK